MWFRQGWPLRGQRGAHPDRGREFMSAIVARPDVSDAAVGMERGLFGNQQDADAARTGWPAEIVSRSHFVVAGELDAHRRFSRTLVAHPLVTHTPVSLRSRWCSESVASLRREYETLVAHVAGFAR